MNQAPLSPEDPRLTAYALGELPDDERAVVEAAVQADPDLQAAVAEIRSLAADLTDVLAAEPIALPSPGADASSPASSSGRAAPEEGLGRVTRFPYFLISGLAAAGFAVLVAVHESRQPPVPAAGQGAAPERRVYELRLAPLAEDLAASADSASTDSTAGNVATSGPESASAPAASFAATRLHAGADPASAARPEASLSPASAPATLATAAPARAARSRSEADVSGSHSRFVRASDQPRATFALDVDTSAYAAVRHFLHNRERPPAEAVRVAGMINYFPYRYPPPAADEPFAAGIEAASAPWNPAHRLVRIGLKGRELAPADRPAANLVVVIDVSGSMHTPGRLPLVLESLRQLVDRLRPEDRIAVVTYAGQSGLALPSTPASAKREIHAALASLRAGAAASGRVGLPLAYEVAREHFRPGGLNRVILCTDGDFNVGVADHAELVRLVADQARAGLELAVLGYGLEERRDATVELLARTGLGPHGYVDSPREARVVLVEQVAGALAVLARDVSVEVAFNPDRVESYRLIGYEDRRSDGKEADVAVGAELAAGHTVTALYEVVPRSATEAAPVSSGPRPQVLPSLPPPRVDPSVLRDLLTVTVRYKEPATDAGAQVAFPFADGGAAFADASGDFKFAAAVAAFGLILRDSPHKGLATFDDVLAWAEAGLKDDAEGHRAAFVDLVKQARDLTGG